MTHAHTRAARAAAARGRGAAVWRGLQSWCVQSQIEAAHHATQHVDRLANGALTGGRQRVVALASSTALRRRFADARGDQAFFFESGECLINRGETDVAT